MKKLKDFMELNAVTPVQSININIISLLEFSNQQDLRLTGAT